MRAAICPTHLHFRRLARHFLDLTAADRFLRFGRVIGDVDIITYVEALFVRAAIAFVVVDPAPAIAGEAHLEFTDHGAHLGLSVAEPARGKGVGTLLLERAAQFASTRGVSVLSVRNLGFNTALQRLADRVGVKVVCAPQARSAPVSPQPNTHPDLDSRSVDCSRPISSSGGNYVQYPYLHQ